MKLKGTQVLAVLTAFATACGRDEPVAPTTGLAGVVLLGPTRPACWDCEEPFSAAFEIQDDGHAVTTFTSDSDGRFSVKIDPGSYVVALTDETRPRNQLLRLTLFDPAIPRLCDSVSACSVG